MKNQFVEEIEQILELGRAKGELTYDEINEMFPDNLTSDQIESLFLQLREQGIDINYEDIEEKTVYDKIIYIINYARLKWRGKYWYEKIESVSGISFRTWYHWWQKDRLPCSKLHLVASDALYECFKKGIDIEKPTPLHNYILISITREEPTGFL